MDPPKQLRRTHSSSSVVPQLQRASSFTPIQLIRPPSLELIKQGSSDAMLKVVDLIDQQQKSPWRLDVILYILAAIVALTSIIQVDIRGMLIPLSQNGEGGFLTNPERDGLLSTTRICRVYDTQETDEHWIHETSNLTHVDEICGLMTRKPDTYVHLGWLYFKLHYYRVNHVDFGDAHDLSAQCFGAIQTIQRSSWGHTSIREWD